MRQTVLAQRSSILHKEEDRFKKYTSSPGKESIPVAALPSEDNGTTLPAPSQQHEEAHSKLRKYRESMLATERPRDSFRPEKTLSRDSMFANKRETLFLPKNGSDLRNITRQSGIIKGLSSPSTSLSSLQPATLNFKTWYRSMLESIFHFCFNYSPRRQISTS
jgi:hypothetical protein